MEKRGAIVELRARARGGEALESAVDLTDPLQLVVPYTRSLYSALFIRPKPQRVLMIGLGGAGFHRLFAAAYPTALLQTVELDPKVLELCAARMAFKPTEHTPVAIMDGRMFVKRNRETWDWLILDAFRGGFVPPHLKTEEFYRECAARLSERGAFVTNLHATSQLYYSDLKTLQAEREMDELAHLVKTSGPVCLLCLERDHTNCHRHFIAEIIEKRDHVTTENLVAPQL